MSSSSNLVNHQHQNARSKDNTQQNHAYRKVWLFFTYYWLIFGIGCYLGQYLPVEWRRPLSITLFVIVLATLFIKEHVNMVLLFRISMLLLLAYYRMQHFQCICKI